MAISFVQKATNASTGNVTQLSATLGQAPSAGNLLVLVGCADSTISTPADWTLASPPPVDRAGLYLWYRIAPSGMSATVTVTGINTRSAEMCLIEYTGNVTADVLDRYARATQGGTGQTLIQTGTTATTTQTDELIVVAAGLSNAPATTATWPVEYTPRASLNSTGSAINNALFVADRIVSATAEYAAIATLSSGTAFPSGLIGTFKASVELPPSRGSMTRGGYAGTSCQDRHPTGSTASHDTAQGSTMRGGA